MRALKSKENSPEQLTGGGFPPEFWTPVRLMGGWTQSVPALKGVKAGLRP